MPRARQALGDKVLQGNLDPLLLQTNPAVVRERTQAILNSLGGVRHVMNLGHGILPQTPLECVDAFVETVREWTPPA